MTKRILCVMVLAFFLVGVLASCNSGEENTPENQEKAENYAIDNATNFYYSTFHGATAYEGYKWTDYDITIKSSEYVDGDFVILLSLDLEASGAPWYVDYSQKIKYIIDVSKGKAKLVDRELIYN